jgi:autoinducer 2-degrading protein
MKTMYHIVVGWDVTPECRDAFIAAALEDGRRAGAVEPGTKRFELIADEGNPNRFYLSEAYADKSAFEQHLAGAPLNAFFEAVKEIAVGPQWLARGTTIVDQSVAAEA